jgi:cell shape-determining protein MreC
MSRKTDVQKLTDEVSRLMAALEDVNFECQRLEIINANLDFQLKSINRELKQNIAMLEALEEENANLKKELGKD